MDKTAFFITLIIFTILYACKAFVLLEYDFTKWSTNERAWLLIATTASSVLINLTKKNNKL